MDAAVVINVIAGPDSRDATCLRSSPPDFIKAVESGEGLGGLRIAWSPDLGYGSVDPEVLAVTESAAKSFEAIGCVVEEATPDIWDARETVWNPIAFADMYAVHAGIYEGKRDLLASYTKASLERGKLITGADYSRSLQELWRYRRRMEEFFDNYDLLLTPTLAIPAFPRHKRPEGEDVRETNPQLFYPEEIAGKKVPQRVGFYPYTYPFNITGQPAASVPCGFSKDGLPIGLQVVGRYVEDATVLKASAAFERAQPLRPIWKRFETDL
jgi:aspartyl-tRNA(Asn)/glutamyl-tRNA(Gln) amidotransferase subunit A